MQKKKEREEERKKKTLKRKLPTKAMTDERKKQQVSEITKTNGILYADVFYTCGICTERALVTDDDVGIRWVGCDSAPQCLMCSGWFHLDCLPTDKQECVEESLSNSGWSGFVKNVAGDLRSSPKGNDRSPLCHQNILNNSKIIKHPRKVKTAFPITSLCFLMLKGQLTLDFFRRPKPSNSAVRVRIWLKFELIQALWVSSLPARTKKIQLKMKVLELSQQYTLVLLDAQGQLTL